MAEIHSLPSPHEGDWDWAVGAACRGSGTQNFYHPDAERGPSKARREAKAKAVCATCPVITNCLEWALSAREPYGIWGGTTVEDRERILAHRRRIAQLSEIARRIS
jgi:WhiB family redox-sensing transcriptional regulator